MRCLVLLGDGMADFPREDCGGTTPLGKANTPAMDTLAREGLCGLFSPIPEGYPAGSDIGNLCVFGYNPDDAFTGRAPLEAANQGIELREDMLAFRCNLVTLDSDLLVDFTAGHIGNEDAHVLIASLNEALGSPALRFHGGVSYRHLATWAAPEAVRQNLAALRCTPPHDIIGQRYSEYLPQGEGREAVIGLMQQSQKHLANHPVNVARRERGELPATSIWLWGQGAAPSIATYPERFGVTGAVISAVDLVNGIGRLAGLEVISVEGATGYLDTNYEGKVDAALDALTRHDFVYLHVEAPDEASHEGKTELKLQAIEDFDRRVVAPCLDWARNHGNCRILVAPDHVTALETRTHAGGPVPFALWGPGIEPNGAKSYSEAAAAEAGNLFPRGYELVPAMLQLKCIGRDLARSTRETV